VLAAQGAPPGARGNSMFIWQNCGPVSGQAHVRNGSFASF
jgi:hypothetical protein